MVLKIAWRNIWRSRTRRWVVIGAIILGILSLIFMLSFSEGLINGYVNSAINYFGSIFRVIDKNYIDSRDR